MMSPPMQALSPVSAAIRPSTDPLPNSSGVLAATLRGEIGKPGGRVAPHPGHNPDDKADERGAQDDPAVLEHFAEARDDTVDLGVNHHPLALADRVQHLRHAVCPDQHRDQGEASGERRVAEREPRNGVDSVVAHGVQEQSQEAGDPAFDRIVGRTQAPGDHHPERCQPEELPGAEAHGQCAQKRREEGETDEPDERAERGSSDRQPDRLSGSALHGERIAVQTDRGLRGGAGDVDEDGGSAAPGHGADVGAEDDRDGFLRRQRKGEAGQQAERRGSRQPGHHPEENPRLTPDDHVQNRDRVQQESAQTRQYAENVHGLPAAQGKTTPKIVMIA